MRRGASKQARPLKWSSAGPKRWWYTPLCTGARRSTSTRTWTLASCRYQEQLAKIDSLLETKLLSQEEADELRPVILAQAKEMMATMGTQNQVDQLGYMDAGNRNGMAVCDVCSILQHARGPNCMVCNASCPSPARPK